MTSDESATLKPLELLELLCGYPFLEKFDLALFYEKDGIVTRLGTVSPLCGVLARNLVCIEKCEPSYERAVKLALGKQKPMVFSCRAGLMNFAVPYQVGDGFRYCFVGGGVRNPTLDLFLTEKLAKSDKIDGFALLEELEKLPSATSQEVKDAAKEVSRLLGGLVTDSIQARLLEKNVEMFRTVRGILAHMEGISNPEDLMGLLSETLGILFDMPRVAIGITNGLGKDVPLRGLIGMVKNLGTCTGKPACLPLSLWQTPDRYWCPRSRWESTFLRWWRRGHSVCRSPAETRCWACLPFSMMTSSIATPFWLG